MNQIDQAPLAQEIEVKDLTAQSKVLGKWTFANTIWAYWLNQVVTALFRPTLSQAISFPLTAGQSNADVAVAFPAGTVALTDFPVLQTPAPPANSCYTAHIAQADQVVIRFNNYGGAAVQPATATFSITVLKQ
jgi:hypothetical protein